MKYLLDTQHMDLVEHGSSKTVSKGKSDYRQCIHYEELLISAISPWDSVSYWKRVD